eukprot:197566-Alexandrium_andersonii.AAC.1
MARHGATPRGGTGMMPNRAQNKAVRPAARRLSVRARSGPGGRECPGVLGQAPHTMPSLDP